MISFNVLRYNFKFHKIVISHFLKIIRKIRPTRYIQKKNNFTEISKNLAGYKMLKLITRMSKLFTALCLLIMFKVFT